MHFNFQTFNSMDIIKILELFCMGMNVTEQFEFKCYVAIECY